jgi:hypothetical protein
MERLFRDSARRAKSRTGEGEEVSMIQRIALAALVALIAGCAESGTSPSLPQAAASAVHAHATETVLYSFTGGTDGGDRTAPLFLILRAMCSERRILAGTTCAAAASALTVAREA